LVQTEIVKITMSVIRFCRENAMLMSTFINFTRGADDLTNGYEYQKIKMKIIESAFLSGISSEIIMAFLDRKIQGDGG
jgi:hypothetical protein